MKTFIIPAATVIWLALGASIATAQDSGPRYSRTVQATVEAIEASTRTLTIKRPDGNYVTVHVPDSVTRFNAIKVGDTITATYYENVVLKVQKPSAQTHNQEELAVTKSPGDKPVGTVARQRIVTVTVTAIDPKMSTISFTGPNGWPYTSRVEDKGLLKKAKVGDKVDVIYTEAMLLSVK